MKSIDGLPLHEAVLRTAIATFVELGFDHASMDVVAARAGTTKRTVYAHFGSKEALFRAACTRATELFLDELPPPQGTDDPAAALEAFAARFCEMATWMGAVRLQRTAMAVADRFPEVAQMLHREVIERAERMVADYLRELAQARRRTPGADLERVAGVFLNMTSGPLRYATLLQARDPAPEFPAPGSLPEADRAAIREATRIFLAGIEATRAS